MKGEEGDRKEMFHGDMDPQGGSCKLQHNQICNIECASAAATDQQCDYMCYIHTCSYAKLRLKIRLYIDLITFLCCHAIFFCSLFIVCRAVKIPNN